LFVEISLRGQPRLSSYLADRTQTLAQIDRPASRDHMAPFFEFAVAASLASLLSLLCTRHSRIAIRDRRVNDDRRDRIDSIRRRDQRERTGINVHRRRAKHK
jgi:hypothetical protein